jgi:hypothetical protein
MRGVFVITKLFEAWLMQLRIKKDMQNYRGGRSVQKSKLKCFLGPDNKWQKRQGLEG